jgi:hypothetical protein
VCCDLPCAKINLPKMYPRQQILSGNVALRVKASSLQLSYDFKEFVVDFNSIVRDSITCG